MVVGGGVVVEIETEHKIYIYGAKRNKISELGKPSEFKHGKTLGISKPMVNLGTM